MRKDKSTLIIRTPEALHRKLKRSAQQLGVSLNQFCVSLLTQPAIDTKSTGHALEAAPGPFILDGASLKPLVETVTASFGDLLSGIVLFGSTARGEAREDSDIDLAIILNAAAPLDRDIYERWRREIPRQQSVEPLFLRLPDAADEIRGVWFELAIDGIVLFDARFEVSRYLSHIRRFISSGGARRMSTYGIPYWVHETAGEHTT